MIEAMALVLLSIASPEDRLGELLRKCREIEDDRARLECFDEAALPAAGGSVSEDSSPSIPSPETESPSGSWAAAAETDPVDGPTSAVAVVPAKGQHDPPIDLVVSCDEREISVSIDWGQYLRSESPAVTVRIDSLPPSSGKWARSEDKHASVFNPGGKATRHKRTAVFVRELMAGQTLAARVIPSGGTAVTAVFDLSGAKAALVSVLRACAG